MKRKDIRSPRVPDGNLMVDTVLSPVSKRGNTIQGTCHDWNVTTCRQTMQTFISSLIGQLVKSFIISSPLFQNQAGSF